MAINQRERILLIVTISLVVVGVNYLLVSRLVDPWRDTARQLTAQRRERDAMRDVIRQKSDWQRRYQELGADLQQSTEFEKDSDVLKKIDELKASSGILMQSISSGRMEQHEVAREWPVTCRFEATIESLVKFLYGLQTSSGFMTVEQINVTAKPDNPNILRCDNVQIRALAPRGEKPAS